MSVLPSAEPKLKDLFCSSKYKPHSLAEKMGAIFNMNFTCFMFCDGYRFLQEVGYEDIFNTNEVNEIKELYNRAQADLTESIN